jgi:uncharacterized SAM-binding protein YcdF (DUF218 family)
VELRPDDNIAGIIVLGGGIERRSEGIRLAHLLPKAKLVLTGTDAPEADAKMQGILAGRLVLEKNARTTYQEALFTKTILQPQAAEQWLLVTSAYHMPRAVGCFRKVGFSVRWWPVQSPGDRIPVARREFFALLAYRLLGRTDELFPSPHHRYD